MQALSRRPVLSSGPVAQFALVEIGCGRDIDVSPLVPRPRRLQADPAALAHIHQR